MADNGRVNILVVDDLPDKLLSLEAVLESPGVDIITANSGQEALRRLSAHDFAVILLDVNMPDMDGFETASLIRQRKKFAHIPIIFITAYSDEIYTARGYSLGAVDYILSPVVPEILRTKVGVFVDLYRKTEEAKRNAEERIILEREQMARAAAEEVTRRMTLLADASAALAASLEYETLVAGFLRVLVPRIGDFGYIALTDEHSRPWHTQLAWADPLADGGIRIAVHEEDFDVLPLAATVKRVLASGTTELHNTLESAVLGDGRTGEASDPEKPRFFPRSALAAPLLSRKRTLGALLLAVGPSERQYHFADLALAEDLAERAAMALDNASLYRTIQERERRKNEFLSMLAHELRNPLAPIRNALHILKTQVPAEPRLIWARDIIDRQVNQMVRMVDDLLDVARITSGKINLRMETVDLAEVAANALETSRPIIEARKHHLTLQLPPTPLLVKGDSLRLAQIVTNLLNNAAKYTEEGGRIELVVERQDSEAVLHVRDSGLGIPASMLSSIFDLFSQADRSLDRSQGGLGIGLTLVRRLVEMHGGSVRAFSAGINRGSEFVVRLPAIVATAAPEPDPASTLPTSNGTNCRILIVDDNVDSAASLSLLLRMEGHEVQAAHDGVSALEAANIFRPDVMLLDIGLPEMDGYEVARKIRGNPDFAHTTIVALTGYGHQEGRQKAAEAGFDCHMVKPVDIPMLCRLISSKAARLHEEPIVQPAAQARA